MSLPARLRPLLAGLTAMLFLAGVIGLATVDGGSDGKSGVTASASQGATTTSTVAAVTGAAPTTSPGSPAAAAPAPATAGATPAGPAATVAPGGSGPPASSAPAAAAPDPAPVAKPPHPGTYHYTSNTGDSNGFDVKVEADGEGGGITHQVITVPGDGGSLRNNAAWTSKQLAFERSELTQGGASYSCNWQPPTTEYAFPLAVGSAWSMDSTCAASAIGQTFTIRRVERSEVKGVAAVSVGGTSVATWVIQRTTTVTVQTTTGKDTAQSTTVEQFAPDRGLFVHRHVDTSGTGSDGRPQTTSTDVSLQSLDG